MDINASVDIGQNLTGLVQKLAEQIGVTADKVFPWYVKQQVIEGWCLLLTLGIAAVLMLAGLVVGLVLIMRKYPHFEPSYHGDDPPGKNIGYFTAGFCGLLLFIAGVGLCSTCDKAISQIKNPEYHATKAFLRDVSNLVPGK